MHTEDGIVSKQERREWPQKKRNFCSPNDSDQDLIGGIKSEDDVWKTTYQRQINGEKTEKFQMSMLKQMGTRRTVASSYADFVPEEYSNESVIAPNPPTIRANKGSLFSDLAANLALTLPDAPRSQKVNATIDAIPGVRPFSGVLIVKYMSQSNRF